MRTKNMPKEQKKSGLRGFLAIYGMTPKEAVELLAEIVKEEL
jgi:hypothetical protein